VEPLVSFVVVCLVIAGIPALIAASVVKLTSSEKFRAAIQSPPDPMAGIAATMHRTTFTPNRIPIGTRLWNIAHSFGLLTYCTIGLYVDDLYVPGRRGNGFHFHNWSAWIVYCAMPFAVANLAAVVVDHYDQRDNETWYVWFAKLTQFASWSLFVIALAIGLASGQATAR